MINLVGIQISRVTVLPDRPILLRQTPWAWSGYYVRAPIRRLICAVSTLFNFLYLPALKKKGTPSMSPEHKTLDVSSPSVAVIGSGYWGKNLVRNFTGLGALSVCV